jgi:hypothetical protein
MGYTVKDYTKPKWYVVLLAWFTGICIVLAFLFGLISLTEINENIEQMQYNVTYSNIIGNEKFQCQAYKHGANLWQFFDKDGVN